MLLYFFLLKKPGLSVKIKIAILGLEACCHAAGKLKTCRQSQGPFFFIFLRRKKRDGQ
jgi:hypothetical protein